jgi:hypothetical protein
MSEETEGVAEIEVEETLEAVAVAVEEAPEAEAAEEVAQANESPEAVADEIAAVVEEAPAVEEAAPQATARREATLYLCERGHRTLIMWGEAPATCNARKTRNEVCGMTLYHSTELPEQVQKALNPIKASKKKSGKK